MEPRRENGLTVRYLAQTIINRVAFPDGTGIDAFVNSLVSNHDVCKEDLTDLRYYFFLHLEDYFQDAPITDKSEIDFILWNEKVIVPVEVKAFTNANDPKVKREIVRNYLHVEHMKNNKKFDFRPDHEIYPVLLYSQSFQTFGKAANSFSYFNRAFLTKKGVDQRYPMDDWERGSYGVPHYYVDDTFQQKVSEINRRLLFTTWENVLKIHQNLNTDGRLDTAIEGLRNARDTQQDINGIPLILSL